MAPPVAVAPRIREHLGECLRETWALVQDSHRTYERMTLADENTDRLRHDLTMLATCVAMLSQVVAAIVAPDLLTRLAAGADSVSSEGE